MNFEAYVDSVVNQSLTLWDQNSAAGLHKAVQSLSDDEWAEVVFSSLDGAPHAGYLLPRFIDDEIQRSYVGSSGITALKEAQRFLRVVLDCGRNNGLVFNDQIKVVDFGSGWGRYTRFMLKYVHPDNLFGLEVDGPMVEHCRKSFGMANFLKVETMPPCDLRDDLVDLVFGYSVFSHLSKDCADEWVREFARIIQPGGLLLMTTQGRSFIDFCRNIRESGNLSHPWYVSLSTAFEDEAHAYRDYDAGEFVHHATGQLNGYYGETLIPPDYIRREWSDHFELINFVDDRDFLPQAMFLLRRR